MKKEIQNIKTRKHNVGRLAETLRRSSRAIKPSGKYNPKNYIMKKPGK
jgi:hypothetical protein